jgi:RNA polymerase sigma factor (sigma-70 family)
MDERDVLATHFEAQRPRLHAVAYRLLGSPSEAEDAVQDAWLRLTATNVSAIENLGGWLTTVVSRICLNRLQARSSRREERLEEPVPEPHVGGAEEGNPEHNAVIADAVGPALLLILDTLSPAERLAFVLHDVFAAPFEEIAVILERSPVATRQLASRARRRVRGAPAAAATPDHARQREIVAAFLAAARDGDFEALLTLLAPDALFRADAATVRIARAPVILGMGATGVMRGAAAVAETFAGLRAVAAQPALIDGVPGAVWAPGGRPRVAFAFRIEDGKIVAIDLLGDPETLRRVELDRQE